MEETLLQTQTEETSAPEATEAVVDRPEWLPENLMTLLIWLKPTVN